MSELLKKHRTKIIVAFLLLIGAFLRFYNLNWGAPFYFHPDERNIADLVLKSSLTNPSSLLKGTFAYGNFPVILTLFLKPLFMPFFYFFKNPDPFSQAIIILRFIEASVSSLTLIVIYLSGKFLSEKTARLALLLSVLSVGFIQSAHFGTYDSFITFFSVFCFYFILRYKKSRNVIFFYSSIAVIAIGAAAKINLIILTIFPFLMLLMESRNKKSYFWHLTTHLFLGAALLIFLTLLFSPNYITLDFRNALFYERNLVTGQIPVFYTQSFYGTPPVAFQFLHILPFLINPLLTIIFIPAFFYVLYIGIKEKNKLYLLLIFYFLILFLPQAFLLAKWTRYMVPTLPFIYLIISAAVVGSLQGFKKVFSIRYLAFGILVLTSTVFSISYFVTAFAEQDTRVTADRFAKNNISHSVSVLTEPYDLGIIPFNSHLPTDSFNFYDLESDNNALEDELTAKISQTNYIILPSQRILRSRILNQKKFPKGYNFYSGLLNGQLGYQKIYESPCDIFCKIAYFGSPTLGFEETATVFERPVVFIFKKNI